MPRIRRNAQVVWEGTAARGSGRLAGDSGALDDLPVTEASRLKLTKGKASPEELISAAHAACLSMSLAGELTKLGHPPGRLEVTSTTTLDEVESGDHAIVAVHAHIRASVPGLDDATFRRGVEEADNGCPVSNLLRGRAEVRVEAELTSSSG